MANILAVDDSHFMCQIMQRIFRNTLHQITTSTDGASALDIAKQHTMDLVLIDLHMPNMDGIKFLRTLRMIPEYHYKPTLVYTDTPSEKMKHDVIAARANAWIIKPFQPNQLLHLTEQLMTETKAH